MYHIYTEEKHQREHKTCALGWLNTYTLTLTHTVLGTGLCSSHHCVMKLLLQGPVQPLVEPQKKQHAHSSQYNQSQVALLPRTRSVLLSQIKSICISTWTSITAIIMLADSRLCFQNCWKWSTHQTALHKMYEKDIFSQYDYVVMLSDFWAILT